MKIESTSPLVLDACINNLKERPLNTRYHPDKDKYVIDTYMMARIIWHDGKLRSEITQSESHLCNMFIKNLIEQKIVSSVLTNNKYIINENQNGTKKAITVKKKKFLEKSVGRNPKFLMNEAKQNGRSSTRI